MSELSKSKIKTAACRKKNSYWTALFYEFNTTVWLVTVVLTGASNRYHDITAHICS